VRQNAADDSAALEFPLKAMSQTQTKHFTGITWCFPPSRRMVVVIVCLFGFFSFVHQAFLPLVG